MVARRPSSSPVSASRKVLAQDTASIAPRACARLRMSTERRHIGLFNFVSSSPADGVPRPGTMTSSIPRRSTSFRRDPQRTVVTLNGGTPFAVPIRLAVANTSWVMAALEAIHPSISRTATLVMSKKPR